MELIVKHPTLPLKAYPDLDKFLETEVLFWLSRLLNLKPKEKGEELVLKQDLAGVSEHCRSMNLLQVKKA